jgi:xylose isomerase
MDANRGDCQNGWDTDQFSVNLYEMVEALLVIAEAGGFGKGGVNFDAKVRRNSTDPEDLLVAHITGIDLFARALLSADAILRESEYRGMRRQRYASFDGGEGKRFENGELTFEDLRKQVTANGEPAQTSGKQELLEQIITMFM